MEMTCPVDRPSEAEGMEDVVPLSSPGRADVAGTKGLKTRLDAVESDNISLRANNVSMQQTDLDRVLQAFRDNETRHCATEQALRDTQTRLSATEQISADLTKAVGVLLRDKKLLEIRCLTEAARTKLNVSNPAWGLAMACPLKVGWP